MKYRSSNIELLRMVALCMIVVYHIFSFCIYPQDKGTHPIYKAIWLPLHIGVVLFILVSGYFRIKPSVKGMVRLLSYMFIYTVPFGLIYHVAESGGGIKRVCETFLFISHSPFWFMRTYNALHISTGIELDYRRIRFKANTETNYNIIRNSDIFWDVPF